MDLKKAAIVLAIVLVVLTSPVWMAATGLSFFIEDWALSKPDSGFAEWTARAFIGIHRVSFRHDKRMILAEKYLDVFDEESAVYNEENYKNVFWAYAEACSDELLPGWAGKGYYYYAQKYPNDERTRDATSMANHFGYRKALQDEGL
jgi:hypothetical protein